MNIRVRTFAPYIAGFLAGLILGFCLWAPGESPDFARTYSQGDMVWVEGVVDGDTVRLADGMHVRYRGCDSPEVFRFVRDPEPLADEATARNRELAEGVWMKLALPEPGRRLMDVHGRLLAELYPADAPPGAPSVAETLVREGLAKAQTFDLDEISARRVKEAERLAQEDETGVWSERAERSRGLGAPIVASRHGKFVHAATCEYALRIRADNLMRFGTIEAARASGRGECPRCRPFREEDSGGEDADAEAADAEAEAGEVVVEAEEPGP